MLTRPLALAALVLAALVAAGTGAYLGVRQNDADVQSAAADRVLADPQPADTPAPVAVEATEAVIDDVGAEAEPAASVAEPVAAPAVAPETVVARAAPPAPEPELPPEPLRPPPVAPPAPADAPPAPTVGEPDGVVEIAPDADAAVEAVPVAAPAPKEAPDPGSGENDWTVLEQPWPAEGEDDEVAAREPAAAETWPAENADDVDWMFEELIVAADSVIGLQIETRVSSDNARVEDPVDATVTRDVLVDNRVAVPAGTRMHGSVVLVERGGRMSKEAKIGVRFHTLVMADSTELPIVTETIYREGEGQGGRSAKTIGGAAVSGAILGAIFDGKRGAILGGAAGAGGGTANVMTGGRNRTTYLPGMTLTVRLLEPVSILVDP